MHRRSTADVRLDSLRKEDREWLEALSHVCLVLVERDTTGELRDSLLLSLGVLRGRSISYRARMALTEVR